MLPQQFLEQILADVITGLIKAGEADPRITVPDLAYTGVANPVVTCEAIQVYMTRMGKDTDPNSCGCGLTANVIATISRDCAGIATEEGVDIPERVVEFSELMGLDGIVLAEVGQFYMEAQWGVDFLITGGIGVTSLTLDLPIPC